MWSIRRARSAVLRSRLASTGRPSLSNETGRVERAVAVDDEAGDVGPEQRPIEFCREQARHGKRAGVPRDMRCKRTGGKSERRILLRDAIRGMIAEDHEGPGARFVLRHDQIAVFYRFIED